MQALAAAITLDASAGDITLASGANLNVEGYAKTYQDIVEYAPAGAVTLAATGGTVTIAKGATVDFAGAADAGNAGSLSITATGATPATLAGTLLGSAAPTFTGGSLLIESEGAIDLDSVTDIVTAAGITNQVLLTSQNGDLTLSAGKTLKAFDVELVADGGQITINGVINASGTANAVNAANAMMRPVALRTVRGSRRINIPSKAAMTNPIWVIGTSTVAWPIATPRSKKMVAPTRIIAAVALYLSVLRGGRISRSAK